MAARRGRRDCLAWACLALLAPPAGSKVLEGHLTPRSWRRSKDGDMVVLGRFGFECVDNRCSRRAMPYAARASKPTGRFRLQLAARGEDVVGLHVALFDSKGHPASPGLAPPQEGARLPWRALYRSRALRCGDKLAQAVAAVDVGAAQDVDVTHRLVLNTEPSFMYLAAVHCGPKPPRAFLYYRTALRNPGVRWSGEFSYEDQGLLQLHAAFLVVSLILLLRAALSLARLAAVGLSHPPLSALAALLAALSASRALQVAYYADYAAHGVGPQGALVAAEALWTLADLGVMVLFLLLAQGWRLTDDLPPLRDQALVGAAALVYAACYCTIASVDFLLRDPHEEVHPLASTGALFLAIIRVMLFLLCALFFADLQRREASRDRAAYLTAALAICALWFLQMPLACLAALCTPRWDRERIATAVTGLLTTAALALFLHTLHPARAKRALRLTAPAWELEGLTEGRGAAGGPEDVEARGRGAGGASAAHGVGSESGLPEEGASAAPRPSERGDSVAARHGDEGML